MATSLKHPGLQYFEKGIKNGDRIVLSKAITLVESLHTRDRAIAEDLIERILPNTGNSIRIGVTGVPGVGKSTFIEVFGKYLTGLSKKVAVLAVDPSSRKTHGSILGDKTRMEELSKDPHAFIRPTATGGAQGGVANATREAILLCEAAGFSVILIETVGVGQSEVAVRGMTDFFLLLMLGGAGDELQGIKKGIMEMADGIVITKADGDNHKRAKQAQADFQHALHMLQPAESDWKPKVLIASALGNTGMEDTWNMIQSFETEVRATGFFDRQRNQQKVEWFRQFLEILLKEKLETRSRNTFSSMEKKILSNHLSPQKAARQLIGKLKS